MPVIELTTEQLAVIIDSLKYVQGDLKENLTTLSSTDSATAAGEIQSLIESMLQPRERSDMFMPGKTDRGFRVLAFTDRYGEECSLQKSSLAFEECIWLGINEIHPKVMASQAASFGIETTQSTGHVPYPIPKEVSLYARMHLTQAQARDIAIELLKFAETGEVDA